MTNRTAVYTARLVDDVSKPARSVAQALKEAEAAAKAAAKGMAGSGAAPRFVDQLGKLKLAKADILSVADAWKAYSKSAGLAANASDWTKSQIAGVKAWEHQTLSALRNVRAEQQAFAASIRRTAAKTTKPGHIVGDVAKGVAGGVSAHKAYDAGKRAIEAGAERQHVRVKAMNAGIGPDERAAMERAAVTASKNAPNLTVSEIMDLHKEARSAVQHPEEAFHLIPDLSKAASILKGLGVQGANISDIVKGGESLGLMNDPKRFRRYLEGQIKAMAVMGKTITTEQVYEAAKYSKSAGATLSDDFLNTTLPSLIQEMHGSSAGDALSMLTRTLRGGMQNKHLPVERLNSLGLLEDPKKIRRSKTGSIKGYAGKVVGDEILASDPRRWFQEIFKPAAEKGGYKTLADQVKLLNETLPSTAANIGRILLQQEETLKQHAKNFEAAPGLDKAIENQRQDAKVGVDALTASLKDLEAALTGPLMPTLAKGLDTLSSSVKTLADAAHESPNFSATIAELAALGSAATALSVAPWVAAQVGMTTLAASLGTLAAAVNPAVAIIAAGVAMLGISNAMEDARKGFKEEGKTYTSDTLLSLSNWLQGKGWGRDKKYVDTFDAEAYAKRARERDAAQNPPNSLTAAPIPPARPANLGASKPDATTPASAIKVETKQLDDAKTKASEAKTAVESLNSTVRPTVDSTSIDLAISKALQLQSILRGVGADAAAAAARIPSLASVQRGNFTYAGSKGE
jgi:hypothetical protein